MMLLFAQGLTLGFSAAVSPGPFLAYLLAQTLKLGARRALPLALVPLLSDGPIVTTVALALSQTPAWFLRGLQIAGGVYLIYLAWGAYRAARTALPEAPTAHVPRSLAQGVLVNVLNPNPWIFWSLIGAPILLEAWALSPAWATVFLLGFYLTLVGGTAGFVILFAAAHRLDPRLMRALNLAAAAALLVFGVIQFGRGLLAAGA
jgi:threonine/homoserine/homoserine lactone efflux protein